MVTINGTEKDCAGITVAAMLEQEQYDRSRIVVEVNLEILPKPDYDTTVLKDGDLVEVVSFVGGG